ncbi:bifunctional (p)ppGpp synthetase/guanosine-3',5'-bis(diphosphate) 3'-pyrophosphohydrolase [Deferribacter thermophilus]|uniref:RelA/SpoT family protein n=1 Tax=Deferribacter thermophilus TaxID=53573 RepID=UPI003C289C07
MPEHKKTVRLLDIQEKLTANGITNLEKLHKAYVYAATKHRGQLRKSGEPYLSHPLNVAYILAEMNMDLDTVVAGLLHDTLEDTDATYEELVNLFGEDVAFLVDGVSKIGRIDFKSHEEKQAETFRKMLISMSKDIRVIVIKLADRLHNMRTINFLSDEKKKRIAKETLEIYAPLAHRLGIAWIKWELEDLSFRILNPEAYYEIYNKVKLKRSEREQFLKEVIEIVKNALEKEGIKAEVTGRPKHFYSIYSKMIRKKTTFEEIYDLLALRILVNTVGECYAVLGIIHNLWKPIQGRIKDYIAMPKSNMYQSLHTTVIGPKGMRVEFQIRTYEMHRIAEEGIAAHWKYKEGKVFDPKEDTTFVWLRQLLEQKDLKDPKEFVEALKEDILPIQIYVFTPNGDIVELPVGSTPIDFAYAIHTEVGHRCVGAKVDGRMVSLKYKLKNGEKVEILTSPNQEPRRDWLNFVKTNRAKTRIRSYLRKKEEDKAIEVGKQLLDKVFKEHDLNFDEIVKDQENVNKILTKFNLRSYEDIIKSVGYGRLSPKQVLHLFAKEDEVIPTQTKRRSHRKDPFIIDGIEDMMIKIGQCCKPLPGDKIKGYITRGRGIVVHKESCKNFKNLAIDEDRIIDVEWNVNQNFKMSVKIDSITEDRPGMLSEVANVIKELGINIVEFVAKPFTKGKARQVFSVEVTDKNQLNRLITKIKNIPGVEEVRVL